MSAVRDDTSDEDDGDSTVSSQEEGRNEKPPTMQMSPLQLRFSQRKMRNVFGDGKLIADSAEIVKAVRRPKEEADLYDAVWKLEAPFPPIEVIRWRCKVRDETTGRPLKDDRGREMFEPDENWFTLDNRRLYCLQRAALKLLPEHCTADVVAEVRKDRRMREIRKFRTMDNGQSIMIGSVPDGVPFERWDWQTEIKNPTFLSRSSGHRKPANGKGKGGEKGDDYGGQNNVNGNKGGGKGKKGKNQNLHGKDDGKNGTKGCGAKDGSKHKGKINQDCIGKGKHYCKGAVGPAVFDGQKGSGKNVFEEFAAAFYYNKGNPLHSSGKMGWPANSKGKKGAFHANADYAGKGFYASPGAGFSTNGPGYPTKGSPKGDGKGMKGTGKVGCKGAPYNTYTGI